MKTTGFPAFLVMASAMSMAVAIASADDYLKFKRKQDGQPLEARVVAYDFADQQVTLVARDGAEQKVAISELSDSDKRLIVKALERQLFQRSKRDPGGNATTAEGTAAIPRRGQAAADSVHWHADLNQALEIARGGESDGDDRPLIWFRVLGDLRGLM